MYAQDNNRPAPVLIVLLFLGIVVLLIFNPPPELQGPSAVGSGTPIPVTNTTRTPTAQSISPTESAVEQTEAVVQTEIGIASGRATLETIDREVLAARMKDQQQVWAVTAEVRSTDAAIHAAEEKTMSTKIANLKSAVNANATQAVIDQTRSEETLRRERQQAMIKGAAIFSIGAAASVTLVTAGVVIRAILSEQRQKEIAKAARLEQERLVIEAHKQHSEVRKTLLAIEQAQQEKKSYPHNGHKPVKQVAL
jgi:hypothetical protein